MRTLRYTMAVGLAALIAAVGTPSVADDTDIYFDPGLTAEGVSAAPNILFVLDTSGSMDNTDGTGVSRLERMKQALREIIANTSGANIGLMRFHPVMGGPIVYPIAAIEGDADAIFGVEGSGGGAGGAVGGFNDIVTPVAGSSDDAEERSGVMYLTDPELKMPHTSSTLPPPAATTLTAIAADNDATEAPGTTTCTDVIVVEGRCNGWSAWNTYTGTLAECNAYYTAQCTGTWDNPACQQTTQNQCTTTPGAVTTDAETLALGDATGLVGVRFPGVAIPQGAVILSAHVVFTQVGPDPLTDTDLTLWGEDADSPAAYAATDGDITTRIKTTATVPWSNVFDVNDGDALTTPSVRSIVQEIVDRATWSSGNALGFLIDGTGNRVVAASEHTSYAAPQLHITYIDSALSFQRQISSDNDDAEEQLDGSVLRDRTELALMEWTGPVSTCAIEYSCDCNGTGTICDGGTVDYDTSIGLTSVNVAGNTCQIPDLYNYESRCTTSETVWDCNCNDGCGGGSVVFDSSTGTVSSETCQATMYNWEGRCDGGWFGSTSWGATGLHATQALCLASLSCSDTQTPECRQDFDSDYCVDAPDGDYTCSSSVQNTTSAWAVAGAYDTEASCLAAMLPACTNPDGSDGVVQCRLPWSNQVATCQAAPDNYTCDTGTNVCTTADDTITNAAVGFRFTNVNIPANALIHRAELELVVNQESLGDAGFMVHGIDETNPATFAESLPWEGRCDFGDSWRYYQSHAECAADMDDRCDSDEPQICQASAGGAGLNNITNRPQTTASTAWTPALRPAASENLISPDVTAIVEELVGTAGWASGNSMAFKIVDHTGDTFSSVRRSIVSHDADPNLSARLRVWYNEYSVPVQQTVGVRFADVNVPQGAVIESAFLEFVTAQGSSEPTELVIDGETGGASVAFSAADTISGRSWTTESVTWPVDEWNVTGEVHQSPDLINVVQEMVNEASWCGGSAMTFRLSGDLGNRFASSYDGNPGDAPVLRVNFNVANGSGCATVTKMNEISSGADDVEQSSGSYTIAATSSDLDLPDQHVGLLFRNVAVPAGTTISDAYIEFTADGGDSGTLSVNITGDASADAVAFASSSSCSWSSCSDAPTTVTGRTDTSASVSWSIPNWSGGQRYRTPNLKAIVEEIIGLGGWQSGNSMAFLFAYNGDDDRRDACSVESTSSSCQPARLVIEYQSGELIEPCVGDACGSGGGGAEEPTVSVRAVVLATINEFSAEGWTPITDALYEASRYYKGMGVYYGMTRGAGPSYESGSCPATLTPDFTAGDSCLVSGSNGAARSRISHPASFSGDPTVARDGNCSPTNPNDSDCFSERVTSSGHSYIQPEPSNSCKPSYLVLLSDGQANRNHSTTHIQSMIGGACTATITTATGQRAPGGGRSAQMASGVYGETCGVDLVKYLHDVDQWPTVDGTNIIKTHTIGFNLSGSTATAAGEFLRELAAVGGGEFYEAASASELVNVFNAIINQAKEESGSFTAPALSVNAYNRLFNRDKAYLTLFEPSTKVRWVGNMKKFGLCTATDGSCEFGELLDVDGDSAVILDAADPNFGQLDPNAQGYWSSPDDSALEVQEGGTGQKLPASSARKVYVHKDRAAPDPVSSPDGTALYLMSTADTAIDAPTVPETDPFTLTIKELLYDTDGDLDADNCDSSGPDNGCLNNLISWMLGATGTNFDEPLRALAGHRWAWSDQLHSEPLVISFGGTEAAPVIKMFGGTNDGGFFMANESTGVEEWIVYPQATLGMQELLMGYGEATNRPYGMDAKPSGRLKDVDGDGIIEADDGDYVHVYIGMRRGGRNLYAFNVTPASPLTDPDAVGGIAPKMLWRIEGGVSTGYGRLGQTWATPIPTKIAVGAESRTVLVMSGGYDPGQDSGFGSDDGMGNAIYIIDPDDGSLLWSVSGAGSGATLELAEMRYSIPGGATVADSNADGLGDTLYAVDVAGQVWRVDLAATLSDSTAARLAVLSNDESTGGLATAPADQRKFFYAPTVARVIDPSYSSTGASEYNLVVFTSGDRANPLNTAVQDRAYAIRDYGANIRIELDGSNAPTNYPVCNPGAAGCDTPLDHGDLLDVTDTLILSSDDTDDAVSATEPIDLLQASHGWYFDLETDGEKGWAPSAVLEDTVFFTTYVPLESETVSGGSCTIEPGYSQLYGINAYTGAPEFADWAPGTDVLTKADRIRYLGTGPTAGVKPIYAEGGTSLLVPTGGGVVPQDPDITNNLNPSYWYEQ